MSSYLDSVFIIIDDTESDQEKENKIYSLMQ